MPENRMDFECDIGAVLDAGTGTALSITKTEKAGKKQKQNTKIDHQLFYAWAEVHVYRNDSILNISLLSLNP